MSRDREAPPHAASVSNAFVTVAFAAVVVDAFLPGALGPVRATEVAAILGLLASWIVRRREGVSAWRTPLDGPLLGALAVLVVASAPWRAGLVDLAPMRSVLAGVGTFYALASLARYDAEALESAWRAFPLVTALFGLHALWAVTPGLAALGAAAAAADAGASAPHALDTALLVAAVFTAGRAFEPRTRPAWRLAAIVGAAGLLLHAAASGSPFSSAALRRLEDPMRFSVSIVVALVLYRLGRTAWSLRVERPSEKRRWRGALAATCALGAVMLYGSGPASPGLAIVAALFAATVVVAPTVQPAAPPVVSEDAAPPFLRAA